MNILFCQNLHNNILHNIQMQIRQYITNIKKEKGQRKLGTWHAKITTNLLNKTILLVSVKQHVLIHNDYKSRRQHHKHRTSINT